MQDKFKLQYLFQQSWFNCFERKHDADSGDYDVDDDDDSGDSDGDDGVDEDDNDNLGD